MRKNDGVKFERYATEKFGYEWKKDSVPFDKGSDIEELKMSIKTLNSSIMTLKNDNRQAKTVNADTTDNTRLLAVKEFIQKVKSENFMLGMPDLTYYLMNKKQMELFLQVFSQLDNESRTKEEERLGKFGKLKLRIVLKSKTRQNLVIEFMEKNGIERKSL